MVGGVGVAPVSMSTPAVTCTAAPAATSACSKSPLRRSTPTLGARLGAASRQAQGFPSVVSDPFVLAELRGLCAAPRSTKRSVVVTRRGPAP